MDSSSYPSKEFAILAELKQYLNSSANSAIQIGAGDDAALRKCSSGEQLVFTADILVEDIHFSFDYMSLEEVGYKAMAVNISDCAAMGAIPDSAMIQLVFPKTLENAKEAIKELYKGIRKACKEYDFPIIGGDLSIGDKWTIGVSMTGRKNAQERLLFRKGCLDADDIWVSGPLGGSAAGLAVLQEFGREKGYGELIEKHISPTARVSIGLRLAEDSTVSTLTDISDGIGKECRTLSYENDKSIIIELNKNMFLPAMADLGLILKKDPFEWVVSGGEDYELLFTANSDFDPEKYSDIPLIKIGKVVGTGFSVKYVASDSKNYENLGSGWDHLAS